MNLFLVTCGESGFNETYGVFTSWAKAYDCALTITCLTMILVYEADKPLGENGHYWVTIRDRSLSGTLDYYDSVVPNPKYNRNTVASITHKEV
jgi:hypothetical protein